MKFPEDSEFVCIDHWDEVLYREALSWVDENRRVAFISEEERISEDSRVKIYCLESPLQRAGLVRKIAWSAVQKKLHVIGELKDLEECHLAADLILSEASDWGLKAFQNALANRRPYRRGIELKGAFQGVPAVIVGAGPSLEKNGHLLKEFERKALIFAGGNALNIIDTVPHFGGAVDAEAPKMKPFNGPFCYQARMSQENFSLMHGEPILFPDGASDLINWMYGEERFDGGWIVGNFLTAIASYLGCSPIILVGMDLCYKQGRKYAKSAVEMPGVETQRDWLMAAKWMEARGDRLINATEGGMLSLPEEKLEAVLKSCQREWDLRGWVHRAVQNLPLREAPNRWDEEIAQEKLLEPLWQIWGPIFEREVERDPRQKIELHKHLFFQQVLKEYEAIL